MALITDIIQQQGFEKVRDAIGAILTLELANQKVLQGLQEDINVYVGRSVPFQQSEGFMINVLLDSTNYGSMNEVDVMGSTNFNIDIFTTGYEDINNIGGYNSSVTRDKYLGMCRSILQSTIYKTLGLPLGLIGGTYCENFEVFDSPNAQDSSFTTMARLSFSVRILENQQLWSGVNLADSFTDVKLDLTDKGYKYNLTT